MFSRLYETFCFLVCTVHSTTFKVSIEFKKLCSYKRQQLTISFCLCHMRCAEEPGKYWNPQALCSECFSRSHSFNICASLANDFKTIQNNIFELNLRSDLTVVAGCTQPQISSVLSIDNNSIPPHFLVSCERHLSRYKYFCWLTSLFYDKIMRSCGKNCSIT